MWRSLEARLLGMQEDVGSNPAIPIPFEHGSRGTPSTGCGAVWLARSLRMREDVGSNPAIPIGALLFGFWSEEIHRDVAQSGKRACSGCRRTSVRIRPSRSHGAPMFPSERGAGGARPLWKRGAWVRVPPFRFSARGPTVGQWSVKPRRFGASGFDSRLAVLLRITARFAASGCSRNPARLVGLRLDSRLAVLLRATARFAKRADVR